MKRSTEEDRLLGISFGFFGAARNPDTPHSTATRGKDDPLTTHPAGLGKKGVGRERCRLAVVDTDQDGTKIGQMGQMDHGR
jgi:hypothetical protein